MFYTLRISPLEGDTYTYGRHLTSSQIAAVLNQLDSFTLDDDEIDYCFESDFALATNGVRWISYQDESGKAIIYLEGGE